MLLIYFENVKIWSIATDTGKPISVTLKDTKFEVLLKVSHIIVGKARLGELLATPGILSIFFFQEFSLYY